MIDKKLLAILACPVCKRGLKNKINELVCEHCQIIYSIENNIPNMLVGKPQKGKNDHV